MPRPFPEPDPLVVLIIGSLGIVFSLVYRIPQIYKVYKTRSAKDISVGTIVIQNISYVAYIVYGVLVWDWVYLASSIISFGQNVIIIALRSYYIRRNENAVTISEV